MRQWLEHEIKIARDDGVANSANFPFLLTPEKPTQQAVLLVHGFSSSPHEMRPLARQLLQINFTVAAVRLPGHGTTPEDLAGRRAEEWLETVMRGYQELTRAHFSVSVGGLSTGAVLTLNLALRENLEKILLLSPFLKLRHPLAPFSRWLHYLIPYQKKEISPAEQPFYYQHRPLKGIAQIIRLCHMVEGKLGRITAPSLILSSQGDATIAPGTAEEIYRQLGSPDKQFHRYGMNVPHVLTTAGNPEQADVLKRCCHFLLEH